MNIKLCSLTGVDSTTHPYQLEELSLRYPFVEWGILYSPKRAGNDNRYPSVQKIKSFLTNIFSSIHFAVHYCGSGVKNLINGELVEIDILKMLKAHHGRVQLNFNAQEGEIDLDRLDAFIAEHPEVTFITQHNENNIELREKFAHHPNHAILFDASLGRGIAADSYAPPLKDTYCGYAGGLGPESLEAAIPKIAAVAGNEAFWVDMEGKLRNAEDLFDLDKAETCLKIVDAGMRTPLMRRQRSPGF